VDQTTSKDLIIPGNQPKCHPDTSLGGYVLLSAPDIYKVSDKIWLFTPQMALF